MASQKRIVQCFNCKTHQIIAVNSKLSWKCKKCSLVQIISKPLFQGRLALCEFFLKHVVELKTHTCHIQNIVTSRNGSTALVKKPFFTPIGGCKDGPQQLEKRKNESDKENKKDDSDKENKKRLESVSEDKDDGDFMKYLRRKLQAQVRAKNKNVDP